ncbi:MAG TPA: GNAT family N-acetyltransferase [Bacteriovoracaceae bacterium]|nr:GNAT family N-acetyltransferase [Bacteriovoracaceae bacterium]
MKMGDLRTILITDPADYASALRIRREVFIEEQSVPQEIEIDSFEDEALHFLCFKGLLPAGTGRLRKKSPFMKFERIATLKRFRRQGVGKNLVTHMQNHAQETFPDYLPAMHAQLDAVAFYKTLEWRAWGETFYEAGIPHLFLTRTKEL